MEYGQNEYLSRQAWWRWTNICLGEIMYDVILAPDSLFILGLLGPGINKSYLRIIAGVLNCWERVNIVYEGRSKITSMIN